MGRHRERKFSLVSRTKQAGRVNLKKPKKKKKKKKKKKEEEEEEEEEKKGFIFLFLSTVLQLLVQSFGLPSHFLPPSILDNSLPVWHF